jgi:hypothetical protein
VLVGDATSSMIHGATLLPLLDGIFRRAAPAETHPTQ